MRILLVMLMLLSATSVNAQNIENAEVKDKIYPVPKDITFTIEKKDFSENELMLLQSLESKRVELERKAQVLVVREKLIDLSEQKLLDKIKKLETLEASIKSLLEDVSEKEERRLNDLTIVYAEMKPKLAAERLDVLDEITVYEVLKRMNFKKSAKILQAMKIEKVTVISKMLAQKILLPIVEK